MTEGTNDNAIATVLAEQPDGRPTTSATARWMARAPLAGVIVVLGVALSVFAWLGLRSIENSEAQVSYGGTLLAQTSRINVEIVQLRSNLATLAGTMAAADEASDDPAAAVNAFDSPAAVQILSSAAVEELMFFETIDSAADEINIREREERLGNQAFVDGYGQYGVDGERPTLVLSKLKPDGTHRDVIGRDLSTVEGLSSIVNELAIGADVGVRPADESNAIFDSIYAISSSADLSTRPATAFYAPVGEGKSFQGVLATRLFLDRLLAATTGESGPVALQLSRDGQPLVSTLPAGELGEPFGKPTTFSDQDSTWAIQGYTAGIVVDHRSSWAALVTGLVLAAVGGLFSTSARHHAITLGRLERSEYDARHDLLTGLYNRAGITQELNHMLEHRAPNELVGVLFLDLDRLKVINDSIGHSAGDEVLAVVARRLEGIVRDSDVVGRFGGDEFVIASTGLKAVSDLEASAERVIATLREPVILDDESSQMVSASIGIAYVAKGTESAEIMLRDADLAMYRAKESGGNRYEVFDDELRTAALARLEVERELRRAIRTGQLVVHFQPIVEVETGRVDRLEALVRWQHPTRGMVPPGQFLSVAAESGLIVDVGEHVLREACRQVALWSAAVGRPICVSVNVAERQLIDAGLIDTVRRVLAETGVRPDQLELEITEELIVEKLDRRLTILRKLDAMGIKLAIDDFGTSRASLGQLKRLDMVATLKIDRAFVIDVANDPVDRKIITAIVALAESMGMEVVAEGVEYADQVSILRDLGVEFIQGFYFQRPGPSEKMIGLLQKSFDVPDAISLPN
ncbi:MAG: EAL domain-containing protein [Acidimicrobiales bacterium]